MENTATNNDRRETMTTQREQWMADTIQDQNDYNDRQQVVADLHREDDATRGPKTISRLEDELSTPDTFEDHMRSEENARDDYLRESGLVETYSDHHLMMNDGI
jgi:hypothetical protein